MRPVIYQLFVRHFSNHSTSNKPWGSKWENGCGTFNGVTGAALEQIRELGATHLWLTGILRHATQTDYPGLPAQPEAIVKGLAGSPYAVTDYYDVDPDLADREEDRLEEFRQLLARCSKADLLPLIDFVPNHVSRAYHSRKEDIIPLGAYDKRNEFFDRDNAFFYLPADAPGGPAPLKLPHPGFHEEEVIGKVTGNNGLTWAPSVHDWYETVKLNYGYDFTRGPAAAEGLPGPDTSPEEVPLTWKMMDDILSWWQELGVAGFRCDMAHMIPMPFWAWAIKRAKERNPSALFIAEAYDDPMKTTFGDPLPRLLESGFDGVYDAPTHHLAHKIYEEGKWANDFDELCNNDIPTFYRAVRYLENHDEPRMGSPLHWGGYGLKAAPAVSTLLFCLSPGCILLYNGQETGEKADGPGGYGGDNGRTSIFDYTHLPSLNRWSNHGKFDGAESTPEETRLREHYKTLLNALQHPALADGHHFGLNWYNKLNPCFGRMAGEQVSGHWLYAGLRHDFTTGKTVLIAANLHPEWDLKRQRILIPREALSWMKRESGAVLFKPLDRETSVTEHYPVAELLEKGFEISLNAGEGRLFELLSPESPLHA